MLRSSAIAVAPVVSAACSTSTGGVGDVRAVAVVAAFPALADVWQMLLLPLFR